MEPKEFLKFDKMITPAIIQVLFWIGIAISVLMGLGMIFSGLRSFFGGGSAVFMGLVWLVLGPVMTRVYCELLMVVFKIHENLVGIRESLDEKSAAAPEVP